MAKLRTYNVEAAKQLADKFIQITGLDLTSHQDIKNKRTLELCSIR